MASDKLSQFSNQHYLLLETYKKDGRPIATPMWFAMENGVLYVGTPNNAGKVKRLRNNPRVRVVPSTARGTSKGTWIDGHARILDANEAQRADQLLDDKYTWQRKLIKILYKFRKTKPTIIAIYL